MSTTQQDLPQCACDPPEKHAGGPEVGLTNTDRARTQSEASSVGALWSGKSTSAIRVGFLLASALGASLLAIGLSAMVAPASMANVLAGCGIAILSAGFGAICSRQANSRASGHVQTPRQAPPTAKWAPVPEPLQQLNETLRQRIEALHDLKWQVSDSQERYRHLLDSQADVIMRFSHDGTLTFVNRAGAAVFGLDPQTSLGQPFVLQTTTVDLHGPTMSPSPSGQDTKRFTNEVQTVDGPRWFQWEEQVISAGPGPHAEPPDEIQMVGRDVTEDRRIETSLAEARDLAEAANRAKSRFLAAMSHEIRTPMNGILGMASLLSDTEQTPEQLTYLRAIEQSARTLLALIDEILDFSKIEAGKLVLRETAFDLERCIQGAIELLAPRAIEKGLEIAWTFDANLPPLVRGDEARVRQILLNLLSNAIKFTDHGGVVVSVKAGSSGDQSAGVPVEINVRDSGIGLTAESLEALFSEFEQADEALRRSDGGTGLGLAISQRLARAMGGEIRVESVAGHGAEFVAELLLQRPKADSTDTTGAADSLAVEGRVLLAFDRKMERRAMAGILEARGLDVVECDLADSLEIIRRAHLSQRPISRIIVDADGGTVSAVSAMSLARELFPGTRVRGLVLINAVARASLQTFRDHGFEAYLVRPVRPATLLAQLASPGAATGDCDPLTGCATDHNAADQQPPRRADQSAGQARKPHILLAEDNDINALLARRMIEKAGCTVALARNGREAVAVMEAVEAGEGAARPDLIFMDIFMPEMDGVEAANRIGRLCKAAPPIVALTANAFEEDRQRYLANGLSDYLSKPFEMEQLHAILQRWLPATLTLPPSSKAMTGRIPAA